MYGYKIGLKKVGESVPAAPANVLQPSLVGNGAVGSVVTCNQGTWSGFPAPTFSYNFRVNSISVQSGASNTYTPLIGDDTKTLTCIVTATNTQGSANATTSNSLVVGTIPNNTVAPVISGTNTFGSTLTTTNGTFTGTAPLIYTYQWLRGGSPIAGQTASTYVIGASDSLAAITCEVTATNSYGFDSEVSNTITVANFAPVNTVAPTVSPSGTQTTGTLITASVGTWSGVAPITYEYKWTRNGVAISGATASTYTIQLADDGTTIRVEVKGTNTYGTSAYIASSNSVSAVNTVAPTNSVAPVISGTAVVGQTLTSTTGTWSGIPTPTYSYQWKRGATNIGTNSSTYTLVAADAGQSITCVVTATNLAGSANSTSNTLAILATVLDIYPTASAAYSLRLLRGAFYTSNAIRVRRSSDNTEQNIGFTTSGNLNTTALTSFVGAGNGFIVTWFDQSGNGSNSSQTTPSNQPQIVSAGSVLMQGANPTVSFNGTSNFMDAAGVTTGNPKSIFISTKSNYIGTLEKVLFDSVNTNQALLYKDPSNFISIGFGTFTATTYTATTNFILYSVLHNSTASNMYVNSANQILTNQNLGTNAFAGLRIGAVRGTASLHYTGNISEFIVYGSNQATNRTQIEGNINSFYGIY